MQAIDPAAFGGIDHFIRQSEHIAQLCRANPPRAGAGPVRLPGDRAMTRRRDQQVHGIELHPSIMPALQLWAQRLGVTPPASL